MKQLYLDIKEELAAITAPVFHIDLLKNQLFDVASIPSLPCAFIDYTYTWYKDTSAKIQLGNAMIRVILGFDPSALAGDNVTDVFDAKDAVYAKLQGFAKSDSVYTPLTRGGERTETKYSDIYLFELDFYTTLQDTGAYSLDTKTNWAFNLNKEITDSI